MSSLLISANFPIPAAHLVEQFTLSMLKSMDSDEGTEKSKELRNLVVFFAHLYNFKVIRPDYLLEIMEKLRKLASPTAFTLLAEILTCKVVE